VLAEFASARERNSGVIVDTTSGTSSKWIDVGTDPNGVVVNPYNAELYVAHNVPMGGHAGPIVVVDLATHKIKQRIEMEGGAGSMALQHDVTLLYCVSGDQICEFAVA
jgi:DNA-binding beta-propeller fold protein YncE